MTHPITPPPELVQQWIDANRHPRGIALEAAQWGADQALDALYAVATGANDTREQHQDLDTIRRALETLPDA